MFRELQPILSKRSLVLTIAAIENDQIRLTITPRAANKDDSKALSVPLIVEGTAAELDAELATALVGYTAEHLTCSRAVERVKEQAEVELKSIKDEAAKRVAEARKSSATKTGSPSSTSAAARPKDEQAPKPAVEPKPEPPPMLDLFGNLEGEAAAEPPVPVPAQPAAAAASGVPAHDADTTDVDEEEQELLREVDTDGTEDEDVAA